MTHVGFTGTRHGMSLMQAEVIIRILRVLKTSMLGDCLIAHHGDCIWGGRTVPRDRSKGGRHRH